MSIRKLMGLGSGLDELQLEVSPRSITLPRNCKAFVLYVEKGMQVIGKFETPYATTIKEPFYRFRHPQPAAFRINNLAHATYAWSLYSINPNSNEETFEDAATFNIERTVKLYQMELAEKEREVQTSMREKNVSRAAILELWGEVRREMKSCRSVQKCLFANQDLQIEFQVEIKNALDFEIERAAEEQQINALRRIRSDQLRSSHSENKNRAAPNVIELESAPYRSKEQIHTRETIEMEVGSIPIEEVDHSPRGDQEAQSATVKIVNPLGQEVDDKQEAFLAGTAFKNFSDNSSQYHYPTPTKKFSMLSDIIERSHEGSSSYGHPERSSSNGNRQPIRKDNTIDLIIETRTDPPSEPINKFKTLPYESSSHHHHRLEVGDQFRRALTVEKTVSEIENSQIQESYLSAEVQPVHEKEGVMERLSHVAMKWRIIGLIILILGVTLVVWKGQSPQRAKQKRKSRAH